MFMRQGGRLVGGLVCAAALIALPAAASASNFPVTNTNDAGAGSLRKAMNDASAHAGPDTITIGFSDFIHLASSLPTVNDNLTITATGGEVPVEGDDTFPILKVSSSGTLSMSRVDLVHGNCDSAGCGFAGGGLTNSNGTVTLDHVQIGVNAAHIGAGIYNLGTMTITDSNVSGNTAGVSGGTVADAQGGAIWNGGTLTLVRTIVSNNNASGTDATGVNVAEGAGIFNTTGATLHLDRSRLDSNIATADGGAGGTAAGLGGGIANDGTVTIVRSTLSHNLAKGINGTTNTGRGGAMANGGDADVTVDRSTVGVNTSTGADFSQAGGLQAAGTAFSITSSTIAHNSAADGANLHVDSATSLKNTILSDPAGGGGDCFGGASITSQGWDLADDATCNLVGDADQPSTNPMLAASLDFNGGPTTTYALQPGSPAIDKGESSAGETVDQRGITRPSDFSSISNAFGGDGTDIGAFEVSDPNAVIDSGPAGVSNDPTPTFVFHANDGASALQCKLDGGSFTSCTSPFTTPHLADGGHTIQVRGRDALGNLDPSPASRSFTVKTAAVSRSGSMLVVTAGQGAKDNFKVTKPSASTIRVTDIAAGAYTGSGVSALGSGCTPSGDYTVNCDPAGITAIKVSSAGNTDRIMNATSLPSSLLGGPANDLLTGGSGNDTLTGGPGADSFKGMNGNDSILAHDSASDTLIDCDGGSTPGIADKADLDLLPNDPSGIVVNCETKTRH
jgi:hypothetical protein